MASDYYRLLREALGRNDFAPTPVQHNRLLLTYQGAQDTPVLLESMTALATGMRSVAQWGTTTNGTAGGNFAFDAAGGWG